MLNTTLERRTALKGVVEMVITAPSLYLSIIVVYLIVRKKKFHTSGYMLMASLSLTSIIFCLNRLFAILAAMSHESTNFPRDFYKAVGAINTFMITSQRLHITLITVNRLVAVVFYLKYNDIFTVRRTATVIVSAWLLAIGLYCNLCFGKVWYEFVPASLRFAGGNAGPQYRSLGRYLLITNIVVGVVCVTSLVVCYPVIIHSLRKRSARVRDGEVGAGGGPTREDISLLIQFGIISLFHFAVWIFEFEGTVLFLTKFQIWNQATAFVYTVLSVMNLCLDPYVYLIVNRDLRKDFLTLCLCRLEGEVRPHDMTSGVQATVTTQV